MTPYKTIRTILLTPLLMVSVPSMSWAQWSSTAWQLNESKSRYECVFCTDADLTYKTAYENALGIMDKWVTSELGAISTWMSSMGYVQPKLPVLPGPFYVLPDRERSEKAREVLAGRLGSYHPDDGIELNYRAFITDISPDGRYSEDRQRDNRVTLAHEVYHGVQAALDEMYEIQTWYSEGMPEAVGHA